MKSLQTYIIIGLLTFLSIEVNAQNQLMGITARQSRIEVKNAKLYVKFDIDISKLDIRSNQGIVLVPIIQSANKAKTLPEVIINGRNRQISYDRTIDRRRKQEPYNAPYVVVRNNKKDRTIISYKITVPFEEWMENSTLLLTEDACGCRNTMQNISDLILAKNIKSPSDFSPLLTYLSPATEPLQKDQDLKTSIVLFPESKSTILLNYGQNKPNIMRIDSILSGTTVKSIHIIGSASPEGAYLFNEQLSKERALSLAAYFKNNYNISTQLDKIEWVGENWHALLKLVEQSDMKDKQQVMDIIKNTDKFSGRENELMKLNSGKAYQYMQEHFFPQLRSASYVVYYQTIPFDVAKGRDLIISDPKSLSANEMLLVANSYPHHSTEYKNAIETAIKIYPENTMVNINASSIALSAGNRSLAKQYLEPFRQQSESWNNLGVLSMMEADYESAYQYFQNAINAGNAEAVHNMEELNKRKR